MSIAKLIKTTSGRRKVVTTVYLEPNQVFQLEKIKKETKIPVAALIRNGVDRVVRQYQRIEK